MWLLFIKQVCGIRHRYFPRGLTEAGHMAMHREPVGCDIAGQDGQRMRDKELWNNEVYRGIFHLRDGIRDVPPLKYAVRKDIIFQLDGELL
jgi:hypothetical protein